MNLQNKVALITGGGSGIGANTASAFVAAGAKVVINGRSQDTLEDTATKIDPTRDKIVWVAGDIGKRETRQQIIDTAVSRFGGVDILFNNAGIFEPKPFLDHTAADLESYLNLLRGYFFLSQLAIAQMQKRGGGAIVNIGSMWASHAIAATPCSASSTANMKSKKECYI